MSIKMRVEKPKEGDDTHQFFLSSSGPMSVNVMLTKDSEGGPWLNVFVYKVEDAGEFDEPVGAYDTSLPRKALKGWKEPTVGRGDLEQVLRGLLKSIRAPNPLNSLMDSGDVERGRALLATLDIEHEYTGPSSRQERSDG